MDISLCSAVQQMVLARFRTDKTAFTAIKAHHIRLNLAERQRANILISQIGIRNHAFVPARFVFFFFITVLLCLGRYRFFVEQVLRIADDKASAAVRRPVTAEQEVP